MTVRQLRCICSGGPLMRLKIRPEDVNALEMSDWLARLRDEVNAETGVPVPV